MGYVFDLDGTLVDSTPSLLRAINTVLEKYGYEKSDEKENLSVAGWGLVPMFRKTAYNRTGDDRESDRLCDEMLAIYKADPITGTVSYPGAYECLKSLVESGEKVAVVTNKELAPAKRILDENFPGVEFFRIYTPDQGFEPKPSSMSLKDFRERSGEDWIVYVGDTELDYRTALGTADEIKMALWGYRGREKLLEKGIPEELYISSFSQVHV